MFIDASSSAAPEIHLDTDARYRIVAWPRYDDFSDLEALFGRFGSLLVEREDASLCIVHNPAVDPALQQSVPVIEDAKARILGADTPIDILLVDNVGDPRVWPSIGRQVSWSVRLPSSDDPQRAAFLEQLRVPVLRSVRDLRDRLYRASILCVGAELPGAEGAPHLPAFCSAVRYDRPNLFLILGNSGQGKSSFTRTFTYLARPSKNLKIDAEPARTRCTAVGTDRLYVEFVKQQLPASVPRHWGVDNHHSQINEHYRDQLSDADRAAFADFVERQIERALGSTDRDVLVEGWHLQFLSQALGERFGDSTNLIPVEVERHTIRIGADFERNAHVNRLISETDETHRQNVGKAYERLVSEILINLKQHHVAQLLPLTTYQCFEDLGHSANNSNSPGKLRSLRLPDLRGKRCLDVGCNTGYFSIRMVEMGASFVKGVDAVESWIRIARAFRDRVYELDGLEFAATDVFDLDDGECFDLILCNSVFHYFRERQHEFIRKCHRLLGPRGCLVLECGVSSKAPESAFVERVARSVDRDNPCHFPNAQALSEMTAGFRLDYEGPSTDQPGDRIPRRVHHLRKL